MELQLRIQLYFEILWKTWEQHLLKEAARKTVSEAGDGTTTATVLAHAILQEAYKVSDKTNSRELKDGIKSAVKKVVKYLESVAIEAKGDMIDSNSNYIN